MMSALQRKTMSDKSLELLQELMYHIKTMHLDMSGKHKYVLDYKAHDVIKKIKLYLWELDNDHH